MPESIVSEAGRPAIVLGVGTQIGLAIVRELGRAGIPVIAISHDPHAIGLSSRHVWRKIVAGPPRSEAVRDVIRRLGDELGPCSLLAISENDLSWINSIRDGLGDGIRPALPRQEILLRVLDKSRTLEAARRVGVDTPSTFEARSAREFERVLADFPLPAILKWADPNEMAPLLAAAGLPLLKMEYAPDSASLLRAMSRFSGLGRWPLVQEYCKGHGLGQFFFMRDGEPVRRFQHARIAEWPPEGGFSAVCESLPLDLHVDLQRKSIALLKELDWDGVAMVEYRYDPATQRAVLMEVNGRFWGSLPLAVACGAGFALHTHASALGEPAPRLPPPLSGVRARLVAAELKRLLRIALQPGRIVDPMFVRKPLREALTFLANFVRPEMRYYVADWRDPAPLFRDLRNVVADRF